MPRSEKRKPVSQVTIRKRADRALKFYPEGLLYEIAAHHIRGTHNKDIKAHLRSLGETLRDKGQKILNTKGEEIALEHITDLVISRAIKKVYDMGIVRLELNPIVPADTLQRNLERKVKIDVDVVDVLDISEDILTDALAKRAAEYFLENVKSQNRIAIAGGKTLALMAENLKSKYKKSKAEGKISEIKELDIYSLVSVVCDDQLKESALGNAMDLTRTFEGSMAHLIQFPEYPKNDDEAENPISEIYREQCKNNLIETAKSDHIFIAIGTGMRPGKSEYVDLIMKLIKDGKLDRDNIQELGSKGESCYQLFNNKCESLMDEPTLRSLKNRIFSVPLETLKEISRERNQRVIVVAGGKQKHEAIFTAINNKLCNHLITDIGTARYIERSLPG